MEIKEAVILAKNALEDKKGEDVKILNIMGLSAIGDYFLIATGNNTSQIQAMSDAADEVLAKNGFNARQIEGYQNASWILMDYGDFMIHIFNPESREFYNLERIWRDAVTEN